MKPEIAEDIEMILEYLCNDPEAPAHLKEACERVEIYLATYQDKEVDV